MISLLLFSVPAIIFRDAVDLMWVACSKCTQQGIWWWAHICCLFLCQAAHSQPLEINLRNMFIICLIYPVANLLKYTCGIHKQLVRQGQRLYLGTFYWFYLIWSAYFASLYSSHIALPRETLQEHPVKDKVRRLADYQLIRLSTIDGLYQTL